MSAIYFNVAPRYSPGSPAQVDQDTAMGVVDDERRAYQITLDGFYGEENRARAEREGLAGIVEQRHERADCWIVTDLITGAKFVRMFPGDTDRTKSENFRQKKMYRLRAKYNLPVEGLK